MHLDLDEYNARVDPAFNRGSGPGWYQRPLPGLEHHIPDLPDHPILDKSSGELRVDALYNPRNKWQEGFDKSEEHYGEYYNQAKNFEPRVERIAHTDLTPSQPHLDESYLHRDPDKRVKDKPARVMRTPEGLNIVQDGHHRIARDMLSGKQFSEVHVWGA